MESSRGRVAAVVLAGGSGTRLGADRNKVYLDLAGRPMLAWSLATLDQHPAVSSVVVAVRQGDEESFAELNPGQFATTIHTVVGGASRAASEMAALDLLAPTVDTGAIEVVLIHDGARPFLDTSLIDRLIVAARTHGGAIPGLVPEQRLFRLESDGTTASALSEQSLRRVQTPQAFRAAPLLQAYQQATIDAFDGVDTAEVVARYTSVDAVVVEGDPDNLKVTTPADLERAQQIARNRQRARPSVV